MQCIYYALEVLELYGLRVVFCPLLARLKYPGHGLISYLATKGLTRLPCSVVPVITAEIYIPGESIVPRSAIFNNALIPEIIFTCYESGPPVSF